MKKIWSKYLGITLIFILLAWVFDSTVQYFFFYENRSFPDLLFLDIPRQELYFRHFITIAFFSFGILFIRLNLKLKTAENESKMREEKYRMLAEHTNDVIWTMDLKGNFTYISPSVKKLRGYEPAEVMAEPFEKSLTPSSLHIAEGLIGRFMELLQNEPSKRPSVVTELEQPRKDGTTVWTEASVSTIFDKNGKPAFFLGVSRDISERKKREQELRRSEENYRLLAETTMDFILVHDSDGYITYVNPAALNFSGYRMEDVLGKKISNFLPENELKRLQEFIKMKDEGDMKLQLYEVEFINASGKRVPVEINSAPILLNKTVVAGLITARDITERLKTRDILVESERRFRSYIENSPLPLFVISNNDGIIHYTNDAAVEFLGYKHKKELLGIRYAELKPEDEKYRSLGNVARPDKNGIYQAESKFINKKGEEVNAIVRSSSLDNEKFIIYAIDISERITAEKKILEKNMEINRLNTSLEDIVKKRTEELHSANRELEAFSYSVSHDLRAPLRHINAFAKLLKPFLNVNDKKAEHYLSNILASTIKMNNLIEDLLLFSRMGKSELHKKEFEMKPLVEQVIMENSYEYTGRNISWEIEEMGSVFGDRKLLRLVWSNLISNAVKFTRDASQAKVRIGRNGKGEYFIADNGVGFDPKFKSKLFNVFQRLHTENEFEGTGIGLANVKRIIDRHGGNVYAEGSLKKGARFSFTLPEVDAKFNYLHTERKKC